MSTGSEAPLATVRSAITPHPRGHGFRMQPPIGRPYGGGRRGSAIHGRFLEREGASGLSTAKRELWGPLKLGTPMRTEDRVLLSSRLHEVRPGGCLLNDWGLWHVVLEGGGGLGYTCRADVCPRKTTIVSGCTSAVETGQSVSYLNNTDSLLRCLGSTGWAGVRDPPDDHAKLGS